ncbi:capsule-associated protein CAP1 [Aspergillus puulaauensis]|uniref:Capsule-associated protein CAP1 n=1 Tax=Aspergillus puulaauensis TaxID=1220207 RepID=A0A7R7XLK0_9EURO|nr:capsule-associated protein CAP1 [Aspergillus puulaauensis]BCS23432.1 capsule-associated protein CAP1 [Aspergillus puulaauensis]
MLLSAARSARTRLLEKFQGSFPAWSCLPVLGRRDGGLNRVSTAIAAVCLFLFILAIRHLHPTVLWSVAYDPRLVFCEHPIAQLVQNAQNTFNATLSRQSQSLEEAVAQYKQRYGIPPPPHFDRWYEFATARNTPLIDDYDSIYHTLLPFWAIRPSVLRARVREDLGHDNRLMGISIRGGQVTHLGNGQGDFQAPATVAMLTAFAHWLPDLDLAFNVHDEPRVMIAHDELEAMVAAARASHARLLKTDSTNKTFSQPPPELQAPIEPVPWTRFYDLELQRTWQASRMSCPLDSPARALNDDAPDNTTAYTVSPLGLVANQTAFSDICQSPSLRRNLGLFNRPNAYKITNQLSPVFSTSKLSTFQDITYPSPWYYSQQTANDATDRDWDMRRSQLYWRGSTTGGHSEDGEWHDLLRQHVLSQLIDPGEEPHILQRNSSVNICSEPTGAGAGAWVLNTAAQLTQDTNASTTTSYFNTGFTEIFQCSPADCSDQEAFFGVKQFEPQEEAWNYRYLLDMDGHAYSGRFYAFLRSASLPFKLSYFREWHADLLLPWLHYVPASLHAREYTELVRYFEHEGVATARALAGAGREWAARVLSNEGMEVWMFRLLLEYARVVDDNRETLGYDVDRDV